MQRVSLRTLALMVELLIAVAVHQYLAGPRVVKADAIWLAGNSTCVQQAPPGGPGGPV
jgi:antibiotic biosynthesis monooxygenase (ABM) superfamily enzyme